MYVVVCMILNLEKIDDFATARYTPRMMGIQFFVLAFMLFSYKCIVLYIINDLVNKNGHETLTRKKEQGLFTKDK